MSHSNERFSDFNAMMTFAAQDEFPIPHNRQDSKVDN